MATLGANGQHCIFNLAWEKRAGRFLVEQKLQAMTSSTSIKKQHVFLLSAFLLSTCLLMFPCYFLSFMPWQWC